MEIYPTRKAMKILTSAQISKTTPRERQAFIDKMQEDINAIDIVLSMNPTATTSKWLQSERTARNAAMQFAELTKDPNQCYFCAQTPCTCEEPF